MFCRLNYLASISDAYILFLLKSSFSACCLFPQRHLTCVTKPSFSFLLKQIELSAIHSPWSIFLSFHVISQIHRLAEVGRHLWRPSAQNRVTQIRLLRTLSKQVWNKYQIIM